MNSRDSQTSLCIGKWTASTNFVSKGGGMTIIYTDWIYVTKCNIIAGNISGIVLI